MYVRVCACVCGYMYVCIVCLCVWCVCVGGGVSGGGTHPVHEVDDRLRDVIVDMEVIGVHPSHQLHLRERREERGGRVRGSVVRVVRGERGERGVVWCGEGRERVKEKLARGGY